MKSKIIASFLIMCIMLTSGCSIANNTDFERNYEYTNYEYNSYSYITYAHNSEFEYFDLLNDQGKMYYDAIYNFSWESSTDMTGIYFFEDSDEFDVEACEEAEKYMFYDHPELELAQIEFRFGQFSSEDESHTTVSIRSKINHNEYSQLINEVDFEIKDLVDEVNDTKDLILKYRLINQWMIDNVTYDYEYAKYVMSEATEAYSTNSTNIYGAIVEKYAVCDGISDAYKYICNKCNIPCVTVSGDVDDTVGKDYGHQWNIVEIQNSWYLIDSTWDVEYGHEIFFLKEDIKDSGRMSEIEGVPGYYSDPVDDVTIMFDTSSQNKLETDFGLYFEYEPNYEITFSSSQGIFIATLSRALLNERLKGEGVDDTIYLTTNGKIKLIEYFDCQHLIWVDESESFSVEIDENYEDSYIYKAIVHIEYNGKTYKVTFIRGGA